MAIGDLRWPQQRKPARRVSYRLQQVIAPDDKPQARTAQADAASTIRVHAPQIHRWNCDLPLASAHAPRLDAGSPHAATPRCRHVDTAAAIHAYRPCSPLSSSPTPFHALAPAASTFATASAAASAPCAPGRPRCVRSRPRPASRVRRRRRHGRPVCERRRLYVLQQAAQVRILPQQLRNVVHSRARL